MGTKLVQALFAAMLAAALPLTAVAQSTAGKWSKDTDCSKSRLPERCQAHLAAHLACENKRTWEYRQCKQEHLKSARAGGQATRREAK